MDGHGWDWNRCDRQRNGDESRGYGFVWIRTAVPKNGFDRSGNVKAELCSAMQGIAEDKQWICFELQGSGRAKRR